MTPRSDNSSQWHRPATEAVERAAYNAAFRELGLNWYWDAETCEALQRIPAETRLRSYIESHHPHLLKAYDAEFLIEAIEDAKARSSKGVAGDALQARSLPMDAPFIEIGF